MVEAKQMENPAETTVEKVSDNLRALADLFEAIENEKVTPEMQKISQEIDTRSLSPSIRTVISFIAGTGPEYLEHMSGDFRTELEQALRRTID